MTPFVSVQGLSKTYTAGSLFRAGAPVTHAVRDVSFTIERNTVMGLAGESGSGKSTLARALVHLDPPSSGEVRVAGIPLARLGRRGLRKARRRMQIVFQDPHGALNPRLRIKHSLGEALANAGVPRAARAERAVALLKLVGLSPEHLDRFPRAFSGGQKQRIVIARALAGKPEFLVLDEPVSSLDVSIQAQIINLLMDLKRRLGLTYLFISHDLNLVSYVSDSIGILKEGSLVEYGPAEQVLHRPSSEYTRRLFGASPALHRGA